MDGEPPQDAAKETRSRPPVTLENVLSQTVTRFLDTRVHEVNKIKQYYQPENAILDVLGELIEDRGLDHRQIFLLLEPKTHITPHRLAETKKFGDLITDEDNWNSVISKLQGKENADEVYSQMNQTVLAMELESPDNFPSPQQFIEYQIEIERRDEVSV